MKPAVLQGYPALPALCALAFASTPAWAQSVPAGTVIENRANAAYEVDGTALTAFSNTNAVEVAEVIDVAVAARDAGTVSLPDGSGVLVFEVTNTGNGPEAFALFAEGLATQSGFQPVIDGLALDSNGNGIYDAGVDTLLSAPEATPELAQDASQTVFALISAPNGTATGSLGDVELRAEAVTGTGSPGQTYNGAGQAGTDAIIGASGGLDSATVTARVGEAPVQLSKTASVFDPFGGNEPIPGATIRYAIRVEVTAAGPVTNLLITDPIPNGAQYLPGTLTLDGVPLTDTPGDDPGEVTANQIVVDLGDVAANTSQDIAFDVVIES